MWRGYGAGHFVGLVQLAPVLEAGARDLPSIKCVRLRMCAGLLAVGEEAREIEKVSRGGTTTTAMQEVALYALHTNFSRSK